MASRLSISAAGSLSAKAASFCATRFAICFPKARKDSAQSRRRQLHRQLRHRRTRQRLHHRQNQGGELKLLNLTKKVHDLLQITKLYTVFDVKDDEATAIKSFTK